MGIPYGVLKIAGFAGLFIVLIGGGAVWLIARPLVTPPKEIPIMVTALPMDIDRIYAISRFRSGAGHDHSYGAQDGETCRSMKHYFNIGRYEINGQPARSVPEGNETNINVYAPFDGYIVNNTGSHLGRELYIHSSLYPSYQVRLGHIDPLPDMRIGRKVKSGEIVGTVGPKDGMDVLMEAWTLPFGTYFVSIFDAMTDDVWKSFAERGLEKEDFIITKEYRDSHPLRCGVGNNKEAFVRDMSSYPWQQDFAWLRRDPFPRSGEEIAPQSAGFELEMSGPRSGRDADTPRIEDIRSTTQIVPGTGTGENIVPEAGKKDRVVAPQESTPPAPEAQAGPSNSGVSGYDFSISGGVFDITNAPAMTSGIPLSGLTVSVRGPVTLTTQTQSNGTFTLSFHNAPTGTYTTCVVLPSGFTAPSAGDPPCEEVVFTLRADGAPVFTNDGHDAYYSGTQFNFYAMHQ